MTAVLDLAAANVAPGDVFGELGRVQTVVIDESDGSIDEVTLFIGPCWYEVVPGPGDLDLKSPVWGPIRKFTHQPDDKVRVMRDVPIPPLPERGR